MRLQLPNVLFTYAHALALYHGGDDVALLPDLGANLLGILGALDAQQDLTLCKETLQAAAQVLEAGKHPSGPLSTWAAMQETARILLGRGQAQEKSYSWQPWGTWPRPSAAPTNGPRAPRRPAALPRPEEVPVPAGLD